MTPGQAECTCGCPGKLPEGQFSRLPDHMAAARRSALTLLELMVVLVILAIVATVALQSLQPQVENQRFQSATQLLRQINSAIVGPTEKYQVDATPLISGFVADVGRLPKLQPLAINPDEIGLGELWETESPLALNYPFQFRPGPRQPTDYSRIRLPCGWRGPYLQLPIGMSSLRDAWGRPLEVELADSGEARSVRIATPPTSEQVDPMVLTTELTTAKVDVTGKVLLDNPESSTVQLVMLIPDPETSLTTLVVLDDEDEQPDSFLFRNIPIGLRAIVIDYDGKRQTKYVQVPHGGLTLCFDLQTRRSEAAN